MNKDNPQRQKLLIRFVNGECSPDERTRVEKLLQNNKSARKELETIRQTLDRAGQFQLNRVKEKSWEKVADSIAETNLNKTPVHELHPSLNRMKQRAEHRSAREQSKKWDWITRVAGVVIVVGVLFYLLYSTGVGKFLNNISEDTPESVVMRDIATQPGERISVTFSDGTRVRLNSGSLLRLPGKFTQEVRKVELVRGEAYFEVMSSKTRPFVVKTSQAEMKVLGTKFNINAYPENRDIEVVVAEGKVAVATQQKRNNMIMTDLPGEVLLTQGELVRVGWQGTVSDPEKVDLRQPLGWLSGMLVFEKSELQEVITTLKNQYDLTFEVRDSSLYDQKLTAEFHNESITKVMDVIAATLELSYEKKGDRIILTTSRASERPKNNF